MEIHSIEDESSPCHPELTTASSFVHISSDSLPEVYANIYH